MKDNFHTQIQVALSDPHLQKSLDLNTDRRASKRSKAIEALHDAETLRDRAHEIRRKTIENLDVYKAQFISKLEENGIKVYIAANGEEACGHVINIAREMEAKLVTKSKSLVTEEVGINQALNNIGVKVIETDLSKYISQLQAEEGEHVPLPSYTLRREDVASLFQRKLGMEYSTGLDDILQAARSALRDIFFSCDIGISGVNFGVVETGTICLVTNEGNGRMVTTLPRVHIALMGMERLVPRMEDLPVFLKLLARSTSGQKQASYVTMLQGPRWENEPDGPDERYVIMVDNGRLKMAKSELAEGLFCIRCFACLNVCPVYREIGGAAYGSVYPGPFGSIVSPGLFGIDRFGHLATASTLCGACRDVCPVKINIPLLLLRIRDAYRKTTHKSLVLSSVMRIYSWLMLSPVRYEIIQKISALGSRLFPKKNGWLRKLPIPVSSWTRTRDFPKFSLKPFRSRYDALLLEKMDCSSLRTQYMTNSNQQSDPKENKEKISKFRDEIEALGGSFYLCDERDLQKRIIDYVKKLKSNEIITWKSDDQINKLIDALRFEGISILDDQVISNETSDREVQYLKLNSAQIGLTGALAGFADTGTLVLPSEQGKSQLSSLLPQIHITILSKDVIFESMAEWLSQGGNKIFETSSSVSFITGPSCSGDIEFTFVNGLHGPKEIVVYCIE